MTLAVVPSPGPGVGSGGPLDWPTRVGAWITDLPAHAVWLWHRVAPLWWPWLPLAALVALLGTVAVRAAYRAVWRRVVAGGYWLAVTPPRSVDPARDATVWRALHSLAVLARGGRWRAVRPPLAFEIPASQGRLTAGLWLPGWVPSSAVVRELSRAWPGAKVEPAPPPAVDRSGRAVAGYRLRATGPHTGWLVDDLRPRSRPARGTGADPDLGSVLAALSDPDGPMLLQVLIRPATARRLGRLRAATKRPARPERDGAQRAADLVVWLLRLPFRLLFALFDLFTTHGMPSSSRPSSRPEPPDAMGHDGMREAKAKLKARPHLLAAIRTGAVRDTRAAAREAAYAVADGYGDASALLRPARLRRPAATLADRWARRGDWLLLAGVEVAVLAHLPADPALYGFDTAALHRSFPVGASRAVPERRGRSSPDWTRRGWGEVPAEPATTDSTTAEEHEADPLARGGAPYPAADPNDWNDEDDEDDESPYE